MTYPIKLSVLVTTYNHEKYLEEALQSVFYQKTDVDFEVIVSDDFSTDSTRKIIEGFIKASPRHMRLLSSEKNCGITKNLQKGLSECQGEYIAILEGDDYWISPHKLQKQVDFLEQHPQCSFCFNGLLILNRFGVYQNQNTIYLHEGQQPLFSTRDLIKRNFIGNFSTCMYRHAAIQKLNPRIFETYTVDWMFNLASSQYGLIGCVPLQMTAYRIQGQGSWSSLTITKQIEEQLESLAEYDQLLEGKYSQDFNRLKRFLSKKLLFYRFASRFCSDQTVSRAKTLVKCLFPARFAQE